MDTAKKNFRRFQQRANQNLGLAEKTQVVTNELHNIEERTENLVDCLSHTKQKLSEYLRSRSKEENLDKRKKKLVEFHLAQSFLSEAACLDNGLPEGLLSQILILYGNGLLNISDELVHSELNIEKRTIDSLQRYVEEYKNVSAQKEKMKNAVLDMDSVRSRLSNAQNKGEKSEQLQEELDACYVKVENCKDTWALELYTLAGKEIDMANTFLVMTKLQLDFYRTACKTLEDLLPLIQMKIDQYPRRPVFGCPLADHLRYSKREISVVLEVCCAALCELGLREEGLFRISGSVTKIKKLKASFDIDEIDLTDFENHQHSIAGALKMYLRELPDPLMTHNLYTDWLKATCVDNTEKRLKAIKDVLMRLPLPNLANLRFLMRFLAKVAESQQYTKMNSQNLAIVIAPNVLWCPHSDGGFSDNASLATLIDCLISNVDFFFPGDIKFVSSKISCLINKTGGFMDEANLNRAVLKSTGIDEGARSVTPPSDDSGSFSSSNSLTRRSPATVMTSSTPAGGANNAIMTSSLSRRPKQPAPPPPKQCDGGGRLSDRSSAPLASDSCGGSPPDDPTSSSTNLTPSHRKTLSLADDLTSSNQKHLPLVKASARNEIISDQHEVDRKISHPSRPPQPDKDKLERRGSANHRSDKSTPGVVECKTQDNAKPLATPVISSHNHTTTLEIKDDTGPSFCARHSRKQSSECQRIDSGATDNADSVAIAASCPSSEKTRRKENQKANETPNALDSFSTPTDSKRDAESGVQRRRQTSEKRSTPAAAAAAASPLPSAAPRQSTMKKMIFQIESEALQGRAPKGGDDVAADDGYSNLAATDASTVYPPPRPKPPLPTKPGRSDDCSETTVAPNSTRL